MVKILLNIIILLILLSTRAYAISMGSLVKNDFSRVASDDSANFAVLFWNIENESYKISLSVKEAPENWIIIFEPNDFILNASEGNENIKLPYKSNYVKATAISVIVKPPKDVKIGKYYISVSAKSFLPANEIELSQERLLKFTVEIVNPLYFENTKNQITYQKDKNMTTGLFSFNTEKIEYNYFYGVIIILIILLSLLIYKYT